MSPARAGGHAVAWLAAQALVFGAMAALLGVVANAMFLDAYGAGWLPATYVAIGVVGVAISGTVARTAERFELVTIALVVLGGAAAGIGAAWVVGRDGDAPWVSIPLLVLFPVLIQLGFVFIGAQAGRLLDIAGLKAGFPRIMAAFPVGAVAGGVVGGQLVGWLGRPEHLLLATAVAQAAFAALVPLTARRSGARGSAPGPADARAVKMVPAAVADPAPEADPATGLGRLLASRFVMLLMAYQVLSALGSQLADYLVYDRAGARFPDPADLARFLAWYTAAMNVVSIAFLVLVAAPLLRRFGLRLGIPANPFVLGGFAAAMLAAWIVAGPASLGLLVTVSAARIADIALTDGTTRTSLQVAYQAVPERTRLAVQAAIEGMGVPIAIALTGVLILGLNLLPDALLATLVMTAVTCAAWSWVAILLYRAYGPALVNALRRRPLLAPDEELDMSEADEAAARRLLSSGDPRAAGLGVELLAAMRSPALPAELRSLAADPRPEVRLGALAGLAASGDHDARRRLATEVRETARSSDATVRLRAARARASVPADDRPASAALLRDPDPAVRAAALETVEPGEAGAIDAALEALADPRTVAAASEALDRLGALVLPALDARLAARSVPAEASLARLVRALATPSAGRDDLLRRHLDHPDRDLGRVILERLARPEPADPPTTAELDAALLDDAAHAGRILAALVALGGGGGRPDGRPAGSDERPGDARPGGLAAGDDRLADPDGPLLAALHDELDLVRDRVVAGRLARHGTAPLGPAVVALRAGGPEASVADEAIAVLLGSREAAPFVALVRPGLVPAEQAVLLPAPTGSPPASPAGADAWLQDLVEDRSGSWRSPWLRACAIHAARRRGGLERMDLGPARALRDPVVDEELGAPGVAGVDADTVAG